MQISTGIAYGSKVAIVSRLRPDTIGRYQYVYSLRIASVLQELLYILGGTTESDSVYCVTRYRSVVCPSVRLPVAYVCLSHSCALVKPLDGMRCHFTEHLSGPK